MKVLRTGRFETVQGMQPTSRAIARVPRRWAARSVHVRARFDLAWRDKTIERLSLVVGQGDRGDWQNDFHPQGGHDSRLGNSGY